MSLFCHLMLLATDRRGHRRQVDKLFSRLHHLNRLRGRVQSLFGQSDASWAWSMRKGICQKLLDLTNRIAFDHKDRNTPFFSFNNWLKSIAVIAALGQQDIRFFQVFDHIG